MKMRFVSIVLVVVFCVSIIRTGESTSTITVAANPVKIPGRIGKTIQFDIYISGIDESLYDLWAWELKVRWVDSQFNLVSVEEGPFLKQTCSGETSFIQIGPTTSGGRETLKLAEVVSWNVQKCGDLKRGALGEGVLATLTFYVIAGVTGSPFEILDITLRNSATPYDQIWPPYTPPGLEEPVYDVILLDEAGEFVLAPKAEDIEPTYGVIDVYDLGAVAANYDRNVTRPRKIPTSWIQGATASWSQPQNYGASDDLRTFCHTDGASTTWKDFMFNITDWTGIQKVEVGLESYIDYNAANVTIALSNDNGTTFSPTTVSYTVDTVKVDDFEWIDVTAAYTPWTETYIESIAVNLTYQSIGLGNPDIRLDYLVVAVTPEPILFPPDVFDPDADVNYDRVVDLDDLARVASNYGTYQIEEEE